MSWLSTIGGLFGGGGGGSSSIWGDLFKGVLSGIGASAGAKADAKSTESQLKLAGLESRKQTAYEAELANYYQERKDYTKARAALDNYGQFSRVSQFAPGYKAPPMARDPGPTPPQPKA